MSILTECIRSDPEYLQLARTAKRNFRDNPLPIVASGLCDGASDAFLVSLIEDTRRERGNTPALILCPEEKDCIRILGLLERCGIRAAFYMARDLTFYNITASHEYEHERLRVLSGLLSGDFEAVVTTPDAALGYTVPPSRLADAMLSVDCFDALSPEALCARLVAAGYTRCDPVDSPGQFAKRGGILDIYPPYGSFEDPDGEKKNGTYALRIEFFGDDIDRMGLFDPETQRMTETVTSAHFPPARELLTNREILLELKKAISAQFKSTHDERVLEELIKERSAVDGALEGGRDLHFLDKYITLIYPARATLTDYFPTRSLVFVRGTNAVNDRIKASEWHMEQTVEELLAGGTIAAKYTDYAKPQSALTAFCDSNVTVHVDSLARGIGDRRLSGLFGFRTRHTVTYTENEELFLEDLHRYTESGYRCLVLAENAVSAAATEEKLKDAAFVVVGSPESLEKMEAGTVTVIHENALPGFELIVPRITVLSSGADPRVGTLSLSGKAAIRKKKSKNTKSILSYAELETGDYVVHESYGIGQYTGIETLTCDGITRDYIGIQYAGTDKLFVPVEKMDKVSKYIGAHSDDGLVKLSKMGGESWKKSTSRARAAVKDIAKDLIRLYAERMRRPGHAFPADDSYQKAFEDAFPYDETESQLAAAAEIKRDMMNAAPMDRLLCGDVGYGKTEVALRAAYKAVLGGKQVALLVPTTLLALQHYQTIVSRMRAFAVNVDMISRFRTAKQQATTLRRLARGDVDIIVGTHRLLSKDISFHDLGLVIIDEEQRFGVAQKEKLKQLCDGVDVLSLSATPIPRTLNMAMGGIRDISILDDAPGDRLPVQTYVLEKDALILEEAIRRELRRGGQVFYLYNSVETINTAAAQLAEAIPEARITVAHGKMEKEELERIWEQMLMGEIDILVSTTIIETGVDIPNANTLIVENAHRLGLSQLHQIRGRIGRSSRRAYAYFTYPAFKAIPEIAEKRLNAIREYAEFGAGFKIALRDMELRGAGNLLGTQQHGHLDAVGYDLYIKLLNRAVLEEKGETVEEEVECTVNLQYDAHIPEKYVPYPAQRMALYKRIALIASEEDIADVTDELVDRYGEPPKAVQNLLHIALIHSLAVKCRITSVREDGVGVHLTPQHMDFDAWAELSSHFPGKLRMIMSGDPHICLRTDKKENTLTVIHKIFEKYIEIRHQTV
ncbi:MAG: transcription-repair coupling factor [Ruminococcaceae bacterium]|nr:transcription-repair coupling factor [Oscillospiraceae bacterium]